MRANTLFMLQQWASPCLVHLYDSDVLRFMTQRDDHGCGDIYLGHIVRFVPHLHAFFVNIGTDTHVFLPKKWTPSTLQAGQRVLVQIHRESYRHKSAQVSMHIQLLGQCLVVFPQQPGRVRASQRLRACNAAQLVAALVPDCQKVAVTIRYEASRHSVEDVRSELQRLLHVWQEVQRRLLETYVPGLVYREPDCMLSALRQAQWDSVQAIYTDTCALQQQVMQWQQHKQLFLAPHVRVEQRSPNIPHMMQQINASYHPVIALMKGGSIHIHETEAATLIDVNSGSYENCEEMNICAAQRIAKEIVLRDLSGVIMIDFINFGAHTHTTATLQVLRRVLRHDSQTRTIAVLTPTPWVHIVRRRVVPSLRERALVACPACSGNGAVQAVHTQFMHCVADILCFLHTYELSQCMVEVSVHPSLHAYRLTVQYPPCCAILDRVIWRVDDAQSGYKIFAKKGP